MNIFKPLEKVDTKTQMEATMISLGVFLCGIIIGGIYIAFFVKMPLFPRILALVNALAGIVLILSFFTTALQQYRAFMSAQDFVFSTMGEGGKCRYST